MTAILEFRREQILFYAIINFKDDKMKQGSHFLLPVPSVGTVPVKNLTNQISQMIIFDRLCPVLTGYLMLKDTDKEDLGW